ncbi:MAG: polynucleotide kinase-phosphatase [Sandaracinaceae bacterium]|nr:polynucleotide kinase-phosphatase [Sandaracinaceae bacterium]
MNVQIPELGLVALVGPSGSGKSTFARRHFRPTEILSSDFCRGLVSDDENDQSASADAFELLHVIAQKRLARGRLVVVDATNVQKEARQPLVRIAREQHVLATAIVLDLPPSLCDARNAARADRSFGPHVVRHQSAQLRKTLRGLQREGFRYVHVLSTPEAVDATTVERTKLWTDRRSERGPFDIIGDVHGCRDELVALLVELGYEATDADGRPRFAHPEGRKAVFVGDLVDRGPDSPGVLEIVMTMVRHDAAICVPGNHEIKLRRKLDGRDVRLTHGLAETMAQLEGRPEAFLSEVRSFIDGLVSHYVFDDGKLVVAHAGMKEAFQGRASGKVREFALYGETTGETDEYGLPVRFDWASQYRGRAMVVYGHTPVPRAEWINGTLCLDTGCVFGGELTALRYPERELVSVPAGRVYYAPVRPLGSAAEPTRDDLLDLDDVMGKRIVATRIARTVTIQERNAAAALEVMSRFGVDPRWLIYLPPTMSPTATSSLGDFLEHPHEAFDYYRREALPRVVCQEKHMGSRAVLVVCRDAEAAAARFGVSDGRRGVITSRTGRPFFEDVALEVAMVARVADAAQEAGLFDELATSWLCLDAELLPWSAKAQSLLRGQYAAVAAAGRSGLGAAVEALRACASRDGGDASELLARFEARHDHLAGYEAAYARYCWPVQGLDGYALAPFHVLASEGRVHTNEDHVWHMETLARICAADPSLLRATRYRVVDLSDPDSEAAATAWWIEQVAAGGEGMVVKPLEWLPTGRSDFVQPALKVRGPEYLRIIYGPEYLSHLPRLRRRGLGAKRRLAQKEFALGIEGLERFVAGAPLYRVHECVFGVLALESEPVDPRL